MFIHQMTSSNWIRRDQLLGFLLKLQVKALPIMSRSILPSFWHSSDTNLAVPCHLQHRDEYVKHVGHPAYVLKTCFLA